MATPILDGRPWRFGQQQARSGEAHDGDRPEQRSAEPSTRIAHAMQPRPNTTRPPIGDSVRRCRAGVVKDWNNETSRHGLSCGASQHADHSALTIGN